MKKTLFILIIIGSFIVRFYKINNPVADWHSWRQADTSSVTRNFVKNKIDLFHPVYDDLSNVASGLENPEGLRYVEFPIYNAVSAIGYMVFPKFSIEVWGRILTIFFSVISLIFIYLITKKYINETSGLLAAFFYAFLPYSMFYGRVILPDPTMVAFSLFSIWSASEYSEKKKLEYLGLSIVAFAVALLVKPTAIFFVLPIIYLIIFSKNSKFQKTTYLFIFSLAFIPLILWRKYILNFPEGIPASSWLLNGDGIRFKGAWWRWLFGERIGKLMLGYWGVFFFSLGILSDKFKKQTVLYLLLFSSFLYLAIFATGNVRHDYYQIPIMPSVAIFCGIGLAASIEKIRKAAMIQKAVLGIFTCVVFALTFALSWYEVSGFYNINHPEIVEAGKKLDEIVQKDAKVVAPYGGDTAFLYQTNRQGWPLMYDSFDISKQVDLGATHFVSVNFDEPTMKIMNECKVLFRNEKYVIVELKCKK